MLHQWLIALAESFRHLVSSNDPANIMMCLLNGMMLLLVGGLVLWPQQRGSVPRRQPNAVSRRQTRPPAPPRRWTSQADPPPLQMPPARRVIHELRVVVYRADCSYYFAEAEVIPSATAPPDQARRAA